MEAHLKIGCVLRTGELGDGFSLLGHQLKHLQQSKRVGGVEVGGWGMEEVGGVQMSQLGLSTRGSQSGGGSFIGLNG